MAFVCHNASHCLHVGYLNLANIELGDQLGFGNSFSNTVRSKTVQVWETIWDNNFEPFQRFSKVTWNILEHMSIQSLNPNFLPKDLVTLCIGWPICDWMSLLYSYHQHCLIVSTLAKTIHGFLVSLKNRLLKLPYRPYRCPFSSMHTVLKSQIQLLLLIVNPR
jgi:hypothetical protein